jgi:MFS family permease
LTVVFVTNGVISGTLVSRLPDFKSALHLSDAQLGTSLLCVSIAMFLVMAPISRIVSRLGSSPSIMIGGSALTVIYPFVGHLSSEHFLWGAFFCYGIALTMQDVSMNSHAVTLEHLAKKRIMTVLHATWSMGTLASVAVGGVLAQLGVSVFWHFFGVSVLVLLALWLVRPWLLPASADLHPVTPKSEVKERSSLRHLPFIFIALGLFGLFEQIGEGAAGDWGGILARDSYHKSHLLATTPYFLFAIAMVLGRLFGDRLATRFSSRYLLVANGSLIAIGLGFGMIINNIWGECFALLLLGLGGSTVIPLLFSAAGRAARNDARGTFKPSAALAFVTTIAYSGFLIGPPTVGYLADSISLHWALEVPAVLGALVAVGAWFVLRGDNSDEIVAEDVAG